MANKHKVRKAALKRFKVTKSGKVLHRSHYLRHLRSKKSKAQVRRLKKMKTLSTQFGKKVKQMLALK